MFRYSNGALGSLVRPYSYHRNLCKESKMRCYESRELSSVVQRYLLTNVMIRVLLRWL